MLRACRLSYAAYKWYAHPWGFECNVVVPLVCGACAHPFHAGRHRQHAPACWLEQAQGKWEYEVQVVMRVGLTELTAEAEDLQTGTKLETSIAFAHS